MSWIKLFRELIRTKAWAHIDKIHCSKPQSAITFWTITSDPFYEKRAKNSVTGDRYYFNGNGCVGMPYARSIYLFLRMRSTSWKRTTEFPNRKSNAGIRLIVPCFYLFVIHWPKSNHLRDIAAWKSQLANTNISKMVGFMLLKSINIMVLRTDRNMATMPALDFRFGHSYRLFSVLRMRKNKYMDLGPYSQSLLKSKIT